LYVCFIVKPKLIVMSAGNKGRELVECFLNAPDGDITRKQAYNFAKLNVMSIIKAIDTTVGHCNLSHLDKVECNSDIEYWNDVLNLIDQSCKDSIDPSCTYPDPVKYVTKSFRYTPAAADFENWLGSMSASGFDVVQVLNTREARNFGVNGKMVSNVLFKWRVV